MIAAREGIGVKDITLLFTDLKESTALYDRIGDLNAFSLVQQHFDQLQDVTVRNNGAIIKTIGDAVMAAFLDPGRRRGGRAGDAGGDRRLQPGKADRELILKIGIHSGAAIAVTLNERLDYFGQTVNIAARVAAPGRGRRDLYVRGCLRGPGRPGPARSPRRSSRRFPKLKGVQQGLRLFCVSTERRDSR